MLMQPTKPARTGVPARNVPLGSVDKPTDSSDDVAGLLEETPRAPVSAPSWVVRRGPRGRRDTPKAAKKPTEDSHDLKLPWDWPAWPWVAEGIIDAHGDVHDVYQVAPEDPYECLELGSDSDSHTLRTAYHLYISEWERYLHNVFSESAKGVHYVRGKMREAWARIAAIQGGYDVSDWQPMSQKSITFLGQWWGDPKFPEPQDPYETLETTPGAPFYLFLFYISDLLNLLEIQLPLLYPEDERHCEHIWRKVLGACNEIRIDAYGNKAFLKTYGEENETESKAPSQETEDPQQSEEQETAPQIYMHYAISEDRSGSADSVMSARLAALGTQERQGRFKNTSLAKLSRQAPDLSLLNR